MKKNRITIMVILVWLFFVVTSLLWLLKDYSYGDSAKLFVSHGILAFIVSAVIIYFSLWLTKKSAAERLRMEGCNARQHELDLKVADLRKELDDAQKSSEIGLKAKATFIANMSHEIRTPMNAIIGFAEVALQDKTMAPQTTRHVEATLSAANELLGALNDILDVSKLDSGKFALNCACFHLANGLANTLRGLETQATENNLQLQVEYHRDLPACFYGDAQRLFQVVRNLVGNAIKFSDQGQVTVVVQAGEEDNFLQFSVVDTGIGMTDQQVSRVFESFTQADETTTRRFGGLGLGAAIAKQIVSLMGGKIWVESAKGQGSTFHFTAYLPKSEQTADCLFGHAYYSSEFVSPRVFNILLAEDIEANATLVTLRLEQQGHKVQWVQNGRQAVELYKNNDYDLILMDIFMPELDGLDATREIRYLEGDSAEPLPILALTASVLPEDQQRCFDAGMDGVLAKPIDFPELLTVIENSVYAGKGKVNKRPPSVIPDHSAEALDFSQLDGVIDYKKALENWVTPTVYAKSLEVFAREKINDGKSMAEMLTLEPDNFEPVRQIAHALKGVAATLVIDKVTDLATQINDDLKGGDGDGALQKLLLLDEALQEAALAITRFSREYQNEEFPVKVFEKENVLHLLNELGKSLDELNPAVCRPIMADLTDYLGTDKLAHIQQGLDNFDFDLARVKLFELTKGIDLTK